MSERRSAARREFVVRVAVGTNRVAGSATWRIWKGRNNDNIYAAQRDLAGSSKVTLHTNRYCHIGLTRQEAEYANRAGLTTATRPMLATWTRGEGPANGNATAVSLVIAHDLLSPGLPVSDDVYFVDDPGPGKAIIIDLAFSRSPDNIEFGPLQWVLGRVALESGETFFVVASVIDFDLAAFIAKNPAVFNPTGANIFQFCPPAEADRMCLVMRAEGYEGLVALLDVGGISFVE
jgi:hypothetical protein